MAVRVEVCHADRVAAWSGTLALIVAAGCTTGSLPEGFEQGPEILCDAPATGIDLWEGGIDAGFGVRPGSDSPVVSGHGAQYTSPLIAHDLDADGDQDLLMGRADFLFEIYENDGLGDFSLVGPMANLMTSDQASFPFGPEDAEDGNYPLLFLSSVNYGVMDLDGDGLPELLLIGPSFAAWRPNLGDMQFGPPELIAFFEDGVWAPIIDTSAVGDVDGDGDLDLLLTGHMGWTSNWGGEPNVEEGGLEIPWPPVPWGHLLAINEGDGFDTRVIPGTEDSASQLTFFTDRDNDGDLDLFIGGDRAAQPMIPARFYRNDGLGSDGRPLLVDEAPELSADLPMASMGLATYDLNDDGFLDYCISDTGPLICFVSVGETGYFDGTTAMGLGHEMVADMEAWSAWSVEFADLDNDGHPDAVATAGNAFFQTVIDQEDHSQPNAIWRGTPDGFDESSSELGFDDPDHHYGMSTVDLDGNGFLDVAIASPFSQSPLWWSGCNDNAWIEVDLRGPDGNREGFGARVAVQTPDRTHLQEIHGPRTVGQGPSLLHFGLGTLDRIPVLTVTWPDGEVSQAEELPTRRVLTVTHPSMI